MLYTGGGGHLLLWPSPPSSHPAVHLLQTTVPSEGWGGGGQGVGHGVLILLGFFWTVGYMCFQMARVTSATMDARALAWQPAPLPFPPLPGPALPLQGAAGAGLFGSLDHAGVKLGVAAGVLCQVVAPHEPLLTEGAPKLLLAGVGSVVPGELVGAGELFKAVGPCAGERSLACGEERVTKDLGGRGVMQGSMYQLRQGAGENAVEGKKLLLFPAAVPASVELLMTRFIRFQSHLQQKPKTPPTAWNSHTLMQNLTWPWGLSKQQMSSACAGTFFMSGSLRRFGKRSASITPLTLPFCWIKSSVTVRKEDKKIFHLGQVTPAWGEPSGDALGSAAQPRGCKHVEQNHCGGREKCCAPLSSLLEREKCRAPLSSLLEIQALLESKGLPSVS